MSFSAHEIVQIAVQIEGNGARFYQRAAELSGANRELLLALADMEAEHEQTFLALRATLADADLEKDEEALQFIRSVADGHVFDVQVDPALILTGEETPDEILATAIGLEKESIIYYAALEQIIVDQEAREKVSAVIREEMAHVAQLSAQRARLAQ